MTQDDPHQNRLNIGQDGDPSPCPPVTQVGRDEEGRFVEGNAIGLPTRFPPGVSGNLTGKPKGVTYPGNWIRGLLGMTEDELEQVSADKTSPASNRMAAQCLLRAMKQDAAAGQDLDRILDHME